MASGLDMGNWDRDAKAAHERVVGAGAELCKAVALETYSQLTQPILEAGFGSPVASGRFTASMRVEINGVDESVAPPPNPRYRYPPGRGPRPLPPRTVRNQPVARVAAKLRTFKLGDKIYISNSLPYSRKIEAAGHSWQAPGGAFRPVVRRVLAKFRNVNLRVDT